jgi:hypothetical protein
MQSLESRSGCRVRRVLFSVAFASGVLGGQAALLSGAQTQPSLTHLGQVVSEHVTLISQPGPEDPACQGFRWDKALFRAFPDGTVSREPFAVPTGQILVVTDVEWRKKWNGDLGEIHEVSIVLSIVVNGAHVFMSAPVLAPARNFAFVGRSEQLTSGFLVGAPGHICPVAKEFAGEKGVSDPDTDPSSINELVLRGYLIQSRQP